MIKVFNFQQVVKILFFDMALYSEEYFEKYINYLIE